VARLIVGLVSPAAAFGVVFIIWTQFDIFSYFSK